MKEERRRPKDEDFEMPSLRLDSRVALISGGNRGLGLGMALVRQGAQVAIAARTGGQLEQAAQLIKGKTGSQVLTIPCDVSRIDQVRGMVKKTADHYGRLDILVNGVGINIRKAAADFSEADWDSLMAVNLKSVFFACQEAARIMRGQGGGKIINLGSLTFEVAVPNVALYATSKGGMRMLTRALAIEWAADNIQVNAIAPGRFWTAMTDAVFSDPDLYESAVQVIPQGRPGIPSDLAGATILLASEAGNYITGQTIVVDGGWLVNAGVKG